MATQESGIFENNMRKTFKSQLQELSVKYKLQLKYDIIGKNVGTHIPEFTCTVKCGDWTAEGTAYTKKAAEHKASENMLLKLKDKETSLPLPSDETISKCQVKDESNSNLKCKKDNYVGKLKEMCDQRRLGAPIYTEESIGSIYIPRFMVTCTLSSCAENATALNKKQAKQGAAKKMFERLKQVNDGMDTSLDKLGIKFLNLNVRNSQEEKTKKIVELYKTITNTETSNDIVECNVDKWHNIFKSVFKEKETLWKNYKETISSDENTDFDGFQSFVKNTFNLPIKLIKLHKRDNKYMVGYKIDFEPVILEIGTGETELLAKVVATKKMIKTIDILLQ
ncbi:interferon-inducible double-stranded RNA-dependent protein kinase activator A homolog [Prorops nasuta]|uniref:interferon-inducible double-stranded RNA-dependent protein kinase activator A homolog n=1 Tax=Prorops nasuta TaxID=863751 RepID=UPI0034CF8E34